jgi:hypothetical protein
MSKAPWYFAGYPRVDVDTTGMGLRDAVNYAYAIASGGEIPDTESVGRARMVQMDPTLADDAEWWGKSWAEIKAEDKYGAL